MGDEWCKDVLCMQLEAAKHVIDKLTGRDADNPLSTKEQATYDAALDFLKRQLEAQQR